LIGRFFRAEHRWHEGCGTVLLKNINTRFIHRFPSVPVLQKKSLTADGTKSEKIWDDGRQRFFCAVTGRSSAVLVWPILPQLLPGHSPLVRLQRVIVLLPPRNAFDDSHGEECGLLHLFDSERAIGEQAPHIVGTGGSSGRLRTSAEFKTGNCCGSDFI
jgi:hypothetical protein